MRYGDRNEQEKMKMNIDSLCKHCGKRFGTHHVISLACPIYDGETKQFSKVSNFSPQPDAHGDNPAGAGLQEALGLPTDNAARKNIPVYTGFVKYFPRAIAAVAELSRIANEQHHPGSPVHWDKSKSRDELDSFMRHMLDEALDVPVDTDKVLHATKMAWRSMANLERILDTQAAK